MQPKPLEVADCFSLIVSYCIQVKTLEMGACEGFRGLLNSKLSSIEAAVEAALDHFAALEPPSVTSAQNPPTHPPTVLSSTLSSPSQRAQSLLSRVNPLQLVGHVDICPETQRSGQSSAGNRLGSARIHHASAGSSRAAAPGAELKMARSVSCLQPCIQIRPRPGRRRCGLCFGRLTDVSYLDL